MAFRKIINDPVYGFITIDDPLIAAILAHRYYQRLRRIHQMAMAHLVYPGAVHTRLHHSLGSYHLMHNALAELCSKGVEISAEEKQGAKIAILLHDIGHGPYSHALEHSIAPGYHHEEISTLLMEELNKEFNGRLAIAMEIFKGTYSKKFLHQLVSGQLDVDRMDYLTRDSFFTGVSEGVIGYDRILKMLTVRDGELLVEEKGIYSIEKFLVARRQMYWQVYLHKTVLSAEQMLRRIIARAKLLGADCHGPLNKFLHLPVEECTLEEFCAMDDSDVMMAIKGWMHFPDKVLSLLCSGIVNRRLLKVRYSGEPVSEYFIGQKKKEVAEALDISLDDAAWLVFNGEARSTTYDPAMEGIGILFKDGSVKDITEVDDPLITAGLGADVRKYYICFYA